MRERGKNRKCELLGIRYPIIQPPMNWVSGADLIHEVKSAKEVVDDLVGNISQRFAELKVRLGIIVSAIGPGEFIGYSNRIGQLHVSFKVGPEKPADRLMARFLFGQPIYERIQQQ